MMSRRSCLTLVAGAGALLVTVVFVYLWLTIPPEPEPGDIPSLAFEPPPAGYRDAADAGRAVARELVAAEKLPGLSLAVAVDGEIVWAEAFGWSNLETRKPMSPASVFRVGGVSQCFTAAAVGLLADRGRLDLDAPVRTYVPDFPAKEWPVSLRQLMAHTSGLRPHRGEGGFFRGSCADGAGRLALFADEPLRSRPGAAYAYSSFGWVLTGEAIAAAAGEPYLDFVQREILTPLGMDATVPDRPGRVVPDRAHFYYPRLMLDPRYGLHDTSDQDLSCWLPAVGFLSTPSDLVRFGAAMLGEGLLDLATVDELQAPVRPVGGSRSDHALGWTARGVRLGDDSDVWVVGQGLDAPVVRRPFSAETVGGQVAGCTATLLTVPEHGLSIAVASNVSGAGNVPELAERLAGVFVRSLRDRRAAVRDGR